MLIKIIRHKLIECKVFSKKIFLQWESKEIIKKIKMKNGIEIR